jgi:hypothetical protein
MHRLDEALLTAAVTQGAPHGPEALRQGALTDALVGLELCEQFVFGYNTIAVLHEVDEHVEALTLQSAEGTITAEFITLHAELVLVKGIDHAAAPLSTLRHALASSSTTKSRIPSPLAYRKMSHSPEFSGGVWQRSSKASTGKNL